MNLFCKLFCVAVIAAVLRMSEGRQHRAKKLKKILDCFPDNVTEAKCFAQLPSAAFTSSSWMRWILPRADDDSYVTNDDSHTRVFDAQDFTVVRVEHDPQYFCDNENKFLGAISCLQQSIKDKCPREPYLTFYYERTAKTLTAVCSRIDDLDKPCLGAHWRATLMCKIETHRKLFGFHGMRLRHKKHKENITTQTSHTWQNSAGYFFCYYRYRVMQCARRKIEQCHGPTARLLFELGKNVSSANCSATMDAWAAADVGNDDDTDCDNGRACGATSLLAVAWATLLLSVFAAGGLD